MAKIASLVALAAVMTAAAQDFPAEVELRNNAWRGMVEPESGAEVPGNSAVTVAVRSADQFQRNAAPEATACASDDRDAAFEIDAHAFSLIECV